MSRPAPAPSDGEYGCGCGVTPWDCTQVCPAAGGLSSSGLSITAPSLGSSRTPSTPAETADLVAATNPASSRLSWIVEKVVVVSPTLIWLGVPSASVAWTSVAKSVPDCCMLAIYVPRLSTSGV